MNDKDPKFFIVGCGRSGTTLLRTMLNHHRELFIPPECGFLTDFLLFDSKLSPSRRFQLMLGEPELKLWFNQGLQINKNKCANSFDLFSSIVELELKKQNKKYWGQQTPRFIRFNDLFKRQYPGLKFLFVVRDPRAVCSSFINSIGFTSYLPSIVNRWNRDNTEGVLMKKKYPDAVLVVKYEDLISEVEKSLMDIVAFLDLNFDNNMLSYHFKGNEEYPSFGKEQLKKLMEKPDISRINSWKNKLTDREICFIENSCCDLMKQFNYSPTINVTYKCKSISGNIIYSLSDKFNKVRLFLFNWPDQLFYILYRKTVLAISHRSMKPFLKV